MNERTDLIIDKEKRTLINNTLFVIAGLGGVGGTALEIVLRFGALNFFLIDGDVFEESNLNRQILSNRNNIGKLKTEEAKKHIFEISETAKTETYSKMINEENIDCLYNNIIRFYKSLKLNKIVLFDCIDDVKAKVALYKIFMKNDVIIVSSMGAGRTFSSVIEATTLDKTHSCPLARAVRTEARKHLNENEIKRVKAVFSSAVPLLMEQNGIIPSSVVQTFNMGVRVAEEALRNLMNI